MRISDLSSDVCSSDLWYHGRISSFRTESFEVEWHYEPGCLRSPTPHLNLLSKKPSLEWVISRSIFIAVLDWGIQRSEGRSVGKESVRTCRSRWAPDH